MVTYTSMMSVIWIKFIRKHMPCSFHLFSVQLKAAYATHSSAVPDSFEPAPHTTILLPYQNLEIVDHLNNPVSGTPVVRK